MKSVHAEIYNTYMFSTDVLKTRVTLVQLFTAKAKIENPGNESDFWW